MIACLSVPYFAAAVERRDEKNLDNGVISAERRLPSRKHQPGLIIGGQPWEPQPVYAFSREAAQHGVKTGMSLRLAQILSPDARFLPAVPARYMSASGEIADVLTDFTHLIEPEDLWAQRHLWGVANHSERREPANGRDGADPASKSITGAGSPVGAAFARSIPARYTLDLESLPLPEALSLSQEIGRAVRRFTHLAPAIGLAESKFTAQVAAILTHPNHARPVPPNQEALFLASRTIHFLPVDKEAARRLRLLGIRTLGQLATIPLSTLQAQFGLKTSLGPAFVQLYHLVQGGPGQSLVGVKQGNPLLSVWPLAQEGQERISHNFGTPVKNLLILENVLTRMATDLAGRLKEAGLEGRTLHLSWNTNGGRPNPVTRQDPLGGQGFPASFNAFDPSASGARLSHRHPTADPGVLTQSLHELLYRDFPKNDWGPDSAAPIEGVSSLTVILSDLVPAITYQLPLFGPARATNRIRVTLNNVIAKHGVNCLYRPVLTDSSHPLPECRFRLQDLSLA